MIFLVTNSKHFYQSCKNYTENDQNVKYRSEDNQRPEAD